MASPAKAGDNALNIALTDASGKPITGAKITTTVAMTSMDMGTTHPVVKETGSGHYAATVTFSMAGPWRVTVNAAAPGQKPQSKSFDFTAN
jgi:nitrogen fixation protein FixH